MPVISSQLGCEHRMSGRGFRDTRVVSGKTITESSVVLHVVYQGPTVDLPVPKSGTCIECTAHMCYVRHGSIVMSS